MTYKRRKKGKGGIREGDDNLGNTKEENVEMLGMKKKNVELGAVLDSFC